MGREVSGVRDAEFLSVFIPSSVCGWSGEWVEQMEERGGADVRAGADVTGDQEGVQAVTGSVEWNFCRSKDEDTKFLAPDWHWGPRRFADRRAKASFLSQFQISNLELTVKFHSAFLLRM